MSLSPELWHLACAVGGAGVEVAARSDRGGSLWAVEARLGTHTSDCFATLARLLEGHGIQARHVGRLSLASSWVAERLAARDVQPVAVLTTRGFGDVLELARQNRRDLYTLMPEPETPLTLFPRELRFEFGGRIDAAGHEVEPLDEGELEALAERIAASGVAAVAVCGIFAPLNAEHELAVARRLAARLPKLALSLSHQVDPHSSEFERFLATAREASVKPAGTEFALQLAQGCQRLDLPEPKVLRADLAFGAPADLARRPLDFQVADAASLWLALQAGQPADGWVRGPARHAAPAQDAGADPVLSLQHALQGAADRMQASLMANARSTIAREAGDCAAALFLPDARMLAQARSLPLLLGSLIPAVQAVLERFPAAAMRPGDGYLLNDPWAGGSHLPDLTLVVPLFDVGRVGALAAISLHHQDVGGIASGSVPPNATSIFEEGLRVPPLQSHRAGQLDAALAAILRANTRTPEHLSADLQAQWDAATLGGRELQPLMAGSGFGAGCEALMARSEAMTRRALAAAPDGRFAWEDQLDSDGVDEQPVPLRVLLVKQGDSLRIDFTGSAAQTRGPANASPASMMAAALYFMRTLAPEAPNNAGCLVPLTLVLPEGSVVNPRWPAAVNARTATVKLACNALLGAWGREAAPVSSAANAGVAVVLAVGGQRADGTAFSFTEIIASGAAATARGPGASGISTDVGNARNTPVEVLEALAPLRIEAYAIRRGSGGRGRHAGGDGVRRVYRLLEGRAQVSYRGERHSSRAAGCAGGEPGASSRAWVIRADGAIMVLDSRAQLGLHPGDRLVIETAGAGGWGAATAEPDLSEKGHTPREAPEGQGFKTPLS